MLISYILSPRKALKPSYSRCQLGGHLAPSSQGETRSSEVTIQITEKSEEDDEERGPGFLNRPRKDESLQSIADLYFDVEAAPL